MRRTSGAMATFAAVAIALVAGSAMAAQDCSITINGKTTQVMEPTPIVMDGNVTWGLRALSDAIDADIYMDSSGVIGLVHGDDVLLLHTECADAMFNDKPIKFAVEPFTFNGSIFVPMNDVIKAFGGTMTCNAPTNQISITMEEAAAEPTAMATPAAANDPGDQAAAATVFRGGGGGGGGHMGGGGMGGGGFRGGGMGGGGFRGGGMGGGGFRGGGMSGGGFRGGSMGGGPRWSGGGRVQTPTGFNQMGGGQFRGSDFNRSRGGGNWNGGNWGHGGHFHDGHFHGDNDNDFWPFALGLGTGALWGGYYGGGYPGYGYDYGYPAYGDYGGYSSPDSNNYFCDSYGNCYYYVYPQ